MTLAQLPVSPDDAQADVCIALVCNDRFALGAAVLVRSILAHLPPGTLLDWRIMYGGGICPLSAENRAMLAALTPRIAFTEIPDGPLYKVQVGRIDHRPALLKMEMLRFSNYRKVIYLDCDMLCIGDISPLFGFSGQIGMVKSRNLSGGWFNTGMMIVDGASLGEAIYDRATAEICDTTSYMLDQPILNRVFAELSWQVEELPDVFNYQWLAGHPDIPDEADLEARVGDIRLLHWCGHADKRKKPWEAEAPQHLSWRLWSQARAALPC